MSKPNKMGMSDAALTRSRAARFAGNAEARRKRTMEEMDQNGMNAIFDAVQSGEITPEEGARRMRELTENK